MANLSLTDRLKARSDKINPKVLKETEIEIPLAKVSFDATQPRKAFHHLDGNVDAKDEAYIAELAASIEENDLIQAITVQEQPDGTYLVVVGECRTRAHKLLGRTTIRAVVRNDLVDPNLRLLYQLAENVNRSDLTDDELAGSIIQLTKNGLTQVQIATRLGKSEGWVSKFIKFSDAENQRVWYASGIADTVEKVYRLSILAVPIQVEILRRVALPVDDPQHLQIPLNRSTIDTIAAEAKTSRLNAAASTNLPVAASVRSPSSSVGLDVGPGTVPTLTEEKPLYGLEKGDAIGHAFASAALDGGDGGVDSDSAPAALAVALGSTEPKYSLSDDMRAQILGTIPEQVSRETVSAPTNLRGTIGNLIEFLSHFDELTEDFDEDAKETLLSVRCDVQIPSKLAQLMANRVDGMVVNERDITTILQKALTKPK